MLIISDSQDGPQEVCCWLWQEANKEDKKDKPGGTTEVQNELHNQGREGKKEKKRKDTAARMRAMQARKAEKE